MCPAGTLSGFTPPGGVQLEATTGTSTGSQGTLSGFTTRGLQQVLTTSTTRSELYGCQACPNGKILTKIANTYFTPTITDNTVTKWRYTCQSCSGASYAYSGATACSACEAGKQGPVNDGLCHFCNPGSSSAAGAGSCTVCPSGKYSVTDADNLITPQTCEACPAGKVSANWTDIGGANSCSACSGGSYADADQKSCIPCPAGKYDPFLAGECLDTLPGTYTAQPGTAQFTLNEGDGISGYGATGMSYCTAGFTTEVIRTYTIGRSTLKSQICTQCPAGSYFPNPATACVTANAGHYTDWSVVPTTEVECLAGMYQPTNGQTSCLECPAGKSTGGQKGQLECQACAAGKYSEAGSSDCTDCPPGKIGTSSGDVTYSGGLSLASFSLLDNVVQNTLAPCITGTYTFVDLSNSATNGGQGQGAKCTVVCTAGAISSITVTTSGSGYSGGTNLEIAANALGNNSGLVSINNLTTPVSTGCAFCPNGKSSIAGTSITCVDCNITTPFSVTSVTSTCVSACPARSISKTNYCETCPPGYFLDAADSVDMTNCKKCPAGKYSYGGEGCSECSAGTFSAEGSDSCTPCAANTISASTASSCAYCNTNFETLQNSKTECTACTSGKYSQPGSAVGSINICTPCLAGSYLAGSSCSTCPAGTFANAAGLTACVICPSGRYSAAGAKECIPCPVGRYSPDASSGGQQDACAACPLGRYSRGEQDPGGAVCTICEAGKYGFDDTAAGSVICRDCAAGEFSDAGSIACTPCAVGSSCASTTGCSSCAYCPIGKYASSTQQSDCAFVDSGFMSYSAVAGTDSRFDASLVPGGQSVAVCPAGRYSISRYGVSADQFVEYLNTAILQSPGVGQANACLLCPAGKWQASSGKSVCDNLADGEEGWDSVGSARVLIGAKEKRLCPIGEFKSGLGMDQCERCSYGQFSTVAGSSACTQPDPGHFSGTGTAAVASGAVNQSPCSEGTYQDGQYTVYGSTFVEKGGICQNCPKGTYVLLTGAPACDPVPGGYYPADTNDRYLFEGAVKVALCPAGSYKTAAGPDCLKCPRGMFSSAAGQAACTNVREGFIGADAAGKVTTSGAVQESVCPAGYLTETGLQANTCNACAAGKSSTAGQTGTLAQADTSCTACPAGKYSLGSSECFPCSIGTYSSSAGMSVCTRCPFGKHGNLSLGLGECVQCPGGQDTAAEGSTSISACVSCPIGESMQHGIAAFAGQCQPCAGASYAIATGSDACTRCPAGRYGPVGSANPLNCQNCPAGTSTVEPFAGTKEGDCTECPYGKFSMMDDVTKIQECQSIPDGMYPNQRIGATAILPCPAGTYEFAPARSGAQDDGASVAGSNGFCFQCPLHFSSNPGTSNKFDDPAAPIKANGCFMCPAGGYRNNFDARSVGIKDLGTNSAFSICSQCPKGKSTNRIPIYNQNDRNTWAAAGASLVDNRCVDCQIAFYADITGLGSCIQCPGGRLTPLPGATALEQCLSPLQNFITGFVVLGIVFLVALEYVIHARFHRLSFLRQTRVATRLVEEARSAMSTLYYYAARAEAERKRDYTKRLFKTWLFLLSGVILGLFITLIIFIVSMGSVFFKSMILWRGLDIDLSFVDTMVDSIKDLGVALGLPSLKVFFYPFQAAFDYFSSINLSAIMESVNVTCKGASAPLELLSNLVILGVTIIIVESNFQLFRAITFNSVTDKFIQSLTQPSYKAWVYRERGTSAIKTKSGWHHYLWTLGWVLIARVAGGFDFFQSFLQFLMSVVSLSKFADPSAEYPYTHASSDECNHVDGYEYYDRYIALAASIEAYILLLPAIYEVSKVLIPGIPKDMKALEDISKKRDPRWSLMHVIKYTSWMMPELWLSVAASAWIRYIKHNIPTTFGRNAQALTDQEVADREANREEIEAAQHRAILEREKEVDYKGSRVQGKVERRKSRAMETESEKIKNDSQLERIATATIKSAAAFRIVSAGTNGKELKSRIKSNMRVTRGFFFAKPGYSIKLWESYGSELVSNAYYLCKIERSTGLCLFSRPYDIQKDGKLTNGRVLADLVADLHACTDDHIVCVYTTGDPKPNRFSGGLPEALYRCGASRTHFGSDDFESDCAYTLVSVGGCGEGSGLEICQGGGKAGIHAVIDVSFEITNDGFKMMEVHQDEVESYWCVPSDSFLLTSFQKRTQKENALWKEAQKAGLPSYWTLCKLEYSELRHGYFEKMGIFGNIPCFLLSMVGLGHILTSSGRRAWFLVGWKLYKFLLLCLGVWSDDVVEMFKVHECIQDMSVVWDKPYKRKSAEAYAAYRYSISENRAERERQKLIKSDPNSRPFWSFRHTPVPLVLSASDEYIEKKMAHAIKRHTESEEMDIVQLEESKRKLRTDYSAMVAAIVSTRSVILQLIPSLTVLSIFASTMSATPIFVSSKRLDRNLPEMIISEPFTEARAQEQEGIDETEWIRKTEVSEEQNCVPNPYHKMVKGKLRVVSREAREAIEKGNEYSRAKMRRIINMPSRTVDEWVVAINGLALYVTESRFINFLINLYRFILTIGILYSSQENLYYWMISAVIILVPYAWLLACKLTVIAGKALYITDADLWAALDCVGLTCLLKWLTDIAGATKDLDSESKSVLKARQEREDEIRNQQEEQDDPNHDKQMNKAMNDDDESNYEAEEGVEMASKKFKDEVKALKKDLGNAQFVTPNANLLPDDHPVLSSKRGVVALSYANKMNFGQKRVAEVTGATRSVVVHESGTNARTHPSLRGKVMYTLERGDECSVTAVLQQSEDPNEQSVYYAQLTDGNWVTMTKGPARIIRGVKDIEDEAVEAERLYAEEEAMLAQLVVSLPLGDYESAWPLTRDIGEPLRAAASAKAEILGWILPGTPMEVKRLTAGSESEPGTAWAELSSGGFFPLYRNGTQGLLHCETVKAAREAAAQEAANSAEQSRLEVAAMLQKREEHLAELAQEAADAHTAGSFKVVFKHGCNVRAQPSHDAEIVGIADYDEVVVVGRKAVCENATVFVERSALGGWIPLFKRGEEVLQPTSYQIHQQAPPEVSEKMLLMGADEEVDLEDVYASGKQMIGAPSLDPRHMPSPTAPSSSRTDNSRDRRRSAADQSLSGGEYKINAQPVGLTGAAETGADAEVAAPKL